MLALIAGQGALPAILARHRPGALIREMEMFPSGLPGAESFRLETLGTLLDELSARGVEEVCFAGAVRRPPVDPARIDAATMPLLPRIMAALGAGDDAALRVVLEIFGEHGFRIVGAHEIAPELIPEPGCMGAREPGDRDAADAERAAEIHGALAAADIGQACVVAAGQALAVETFGGTDWMLATLAGDRRPDGPSGGVLYKAPKAGQDRRIDLPAIGAETVRGAASAGLSGIVIAAGGVMVLGTDEVIAAADAAGLFLWVRAA